MGKIEEITDDISHTERSYKENGPKSVDDVKHAYVMGWIDDDMLTQDLETVGGDG